MWDVTGRREYVVMSRGGKTLLTSWRGAWEHLVTCGEVVLPNQEDGVSESYGVTV